MCAKNRDKHRGYCQINWKLEPKRDVALQVCRATGRWGSYFQDFNTPNSTDLPPTLAALIAIVVGGSIARNYK